MRKVYFNLDNGKCVHPGSIPHYVAHVDIFQRIIKLEATFLINNIEREGQKWKEKQLKGLRNDFNNYPWLRKSLKRLIWKSIFNPYRFDTGLLLGSFGRTIWKFEAFYEKS